MDKGFLAIIAAIIIAVIACSPRNDTFEQLIAADSLILNHNYTDSGMQILKYTEPITRKDSTYYNILKTAASYRSENPTKSFDGINASIKYYTDKYDARKLAYAYYYKATIFINTDSIVPEMFFLLKNAEKYAEKTTDYRLSDRVYSVLTFVNSRVGELDEALNCARKELYYAQRLNDNYCKAYALINLVILHHYLSPDTDSSAYYIRQCRMFADNVEDNDKSFIYNHIGQTIMSTDTSQAKKYFIDALKYRKLPGAYLNLAKLYYAGNQIDIALKYCDSALTAPSLQSKKETYTFMAEHYYKNKDIKQYKKAIEEIIETQAQISQEKENRKMLELQKKFDYEKQRAEYDRKKLLLCSIISLLALLIVALALFHKLRLQKIRTHELALENQNTLLYNEIIAMTTNEDLYKKQIAELESENQNLALQKSDLSKIIANNKTRITILQGKVEKLNTQKYEYIESGKMIYHKMEQNLPITMFDDKWANCVYYFSFSMMENIFEGYGSLTVSDKIFLITDVFLKKNDDEIAKIFAISPVTVRSRRSKIKKKKESFDV